MKRAATIILTTLALGACVTRPDGDTGPSPGLPPPAPTLGMDWIFDPEEDSAELMYGTPQSDNVHLAIECRGMGDQIIGLTRVAPAGSPAEIVLQSGGKTQRYPANSEPDEISGGVVLTTRLARKSDPVMQALRETGWLSVLHEGKPEHYIPQHNNSAVADFFRWCGP